MIQKLTVSAVFFGAIILAGCNSDKGTGSGGAIDPANIIGNWINSAMTIEPGVDFGTGTLITDLWTAGFVDDCMKDDVTTFAGSGNSGTYTRTDGAISCPNPDTDAGTWTFAGNVLIQTSTGSTTADTTIIASLTATTAVVQEMISAADAPDNIAHTITITAHKQ